MNKEEFLKKFISELEAEVEADRYGDEIGVGLALLLVAKNHPDTFCDALSNVCNQQCLSAFIHGCLSAGATQEEIPGLIHSNICCDGYPATTKN